MIYCFLSSKVARIVVHDMELRHQDQDSESWVSIRPETKTQKCIQNWKNKHITFSLLLPVLFRSRKNTYYALKFSLKGASSNQNSNFSSL